MTGIYYPIPVHRQPYVLERGLRADLPVTDRAAARTLSLPMHPGLTEAEQATVIDAVPAAVGRQRRSPRRCRAPDDRRAGRPAGERELRVGLAGLGSMGRNHLRVLSRWPGARLTAVADPGPRCPRRPPPPGTGAQGFADPLAMIGEADLDAVVIAAPTTTHLPLALAAIERGVAVLVEKPLAAHARGGAP